MQINAGPMLSASISMSLSALVGVSVAMTKHDDQKANWKEGLVYLAYTSAL